MVGPGEAIGGAESMADAERARANTSMLGAALAETTKTNSLCPDDVTSVLRVLENYAPSWLDDPTDIRGIAFRGFVRGLVARIETTDEKNAAKAKDASEAETQ